MPSPKRRRPYYGRWSLLCLGCLGSPVRTMKEWEGRQQALAVAQAHADETNHTVIVAHRMEYTIKKEEADATLRNP